MTNFPLYFLNPKIPTVFLKIDWVFNVQTTKISSQYAVSLLRFPHTRSRSLSVSGHNAWASFFILHSLRAWALLLFGSSLVFRCWFFFWERASYRYQIHFGIRMKIGFCDVRDVENGKQAIMMMILTTCNRIPIKKILDSVRRTLFKWKFRWMGIKRITIRLLLCHKNSTNVHLYLRIYME